jgi:ankyrin repeat protein
MLHLQALHDADKELACTFMLIRAGANINAQARTGLDDEPIMENEHGIRYGQETPLHSAARSGSKLQVRLLLDHGADASLKTVSRIVEPEKLTEWTEGVTSFLWPMTEFKRVLFEPYAGETPLEMAIRYGHHEVAAILDERTN